MPDLHFSIDDARVTSDATTPQLSFRLRVIDKESAPVQAVLLRVQIRIEPTRRKYDTANEWPLRDLFGAPQGWGRSMRSMLWTHASIIVPPFSGSTEVELPVPCSYDFNLAATKYFHALADGEVPLCFLFSGTVFYQAATGLQATQISWEREANFRLPIATRTKLSERFCQQGAWLPLGKNVFDRLYEHKVQNGLAAWDQVIEKLLTASEQPVLEPR